MLAGGRSRDGHARDDWRRRSPVRSPGRGSTAATAISSTTPSTTPGGGNRSYADFARRSPIPAREDGRTTTPRNSPPLVNSALARGRPFFLHFDGEFPSTAALVEGTLTGRNFGWLPGEHGQAVAHIAAVIRGDDGIGQLAQDFGGSVPPRAGGHGSRRSRRTSGSRRTLPRSTSTAPATSRSCAPSRGSSRPTSNRSSSQNASPYDRFLEKNNLPGEPREFEPADSYVAAPEAPPRRARRRRTSSRPPTARSSSSDQPFVFGDARAGGAAHLPRPQARNCVACHPPPLFTDFRFHNTGAHRRRNTMRCTAPGSFAALSIPDARDPQRRSRRRTCRPRRRTRTAAEPFRATRRRRRAGPHRPRDVEHLAQPRLPEAPPAAPPARGWCARRWDRLAPAAGPRTALVDAAIGLFKTPGLRTLAQSAPYLHTGAKDTLEDVRALLRHQVGARAQRASSATARASCATCRSARPTSRRWPRSCAR